MTSTVQSVIIRKSVFPTQQAARKKVMKLGFKDNGVDEKERTWRFRQVDPGEFHHFTIMNISKGVQLVIGWYK